MRGMLASVGCGGSLWEEETFPLAVFASPCPVGTESCVCVHLS